MGIFSFYDFVNEKLGVSEASLLFVSILSSCGPRRYGCGPRRCEVKTQKQPTVPQTLEKNTGRVV